MICMAARCLRMRSKGYVVSVGQRKHGWSNGRLLTREHRISTILCS